MSKIRIKSLLEDLVENEKTEVSTKGNLNDGIISYIENKIEVFIEISSANEVVIKRRCDEYELVLNCDRNSNTKGTYNIIGVGNLDVEVETEALDISSNRIDIKYNLGQNSQKYGEFKFCLEYEEDNE